jgi:hypothetical protein
MSQSQSISQMLALRKVTRSVADHLSQQLRSHLATLAPLVNPRNVFGLHLRSSTKQSAKGENEAFEQLKGLYVPLAGSTSFNLRKDLESPLDTVSIQPEIAPLDYTYEVHDAGQAKIIAMTSPLKWVLFFAGNSPKRLRELLAQQKTIVGSELQQCVLSYLIMHVTLLQRPGVTQILEALRFRVTTEHWEEFGNLPLTCIESPVSTIRPTDEVIIQSTEISGSPAFEEVVSPEEIAAMTDPFKERLVALAAT